MAEAARLGDEVGHEFNPLEKAGGLFGSVLGAGVASFVGLPALVFGGSVYENVVSFGRAAGGQAGSAVGRWVGEELGISCMTTTGLILMGDDSVMIEGQPAARACVDLSGCSHHAPGVIITGSESVLIDGRPAARRGDTGACGFEVLSGANSVTIGGAKHTCLCAKLWQKYKEQAQAIIAPHDGDHRARNRAISKAYAEMYVKRPEFVWLGLAAYASKEVGCAMDHARSLDGIFSPPADYTYEALGRGNRELFLDVYPMYLFFAEHGFAKMSECASARNPPMTPEALAAFEALDPNRPGGPDEERHLRELTFHEQINILQEEIYNDSLLQVILLGNEAGMPGALPAKVTFSGRCGESGREFGFNQGWVGDGHGVAPEIFRPYERMKWILREPTEYYNEIEGSPLHHDHLEEIIEDGP